MMIYQEVLGAFQKQKVKYVLVGGIAANLHGAMRTTADLDILVEMSDRNLAKVVRILKKLGYQVRQPVDPMGIADRNTRENWIKNKHMKAFNFFKDRDYQEVDIIIDSPVPFETAKKDMIRVRIENLNLPLISIDHLIKMKQKAMRAIDQLDIHQLKMIKKMKRRA